MYQPVRIKPFYGSIEAKLSSDFDLPSDDLTKRMLMERKFFFNAGHSARWFFFFLNFLSNG